MFASIGYAHRFEFIAGWLCLEFANTINYAGVNPNERLTGFTELLAWGCLAGLITDSKAQALMDEAAGHPAEAAEALDEARALRRAMHRIFSAVAYHDTPDAADMAALNAAASAAFPHLRLKSGLAGFGWDWSAEPADLNQVLWPVVWSAGDLLTSADLIYVKRCQGTGCGWLFLDQTRNHSRRWCSMSECGNRAKAHRHYQRRQTHA